MSNSNNNQQNILVLSFIPDRETATFLTPILNYLGGHYDDENLKFRDFSSRYKLADLFAKMYQGHIDISADNPFISVAAKNIEHAKIMADPFVVIDYHPDSGLESVITVLRPYGLGFANGSISVAANTLAGYMPHEVAASAIQVMSRQKDDCHQWVKELDIPVIYYFKDKSDHIDFGYSRGCRKPRAANLYGHEYISGLSLVLSEIDDIQVIYSDPVPSGSIGEDTFQDYLFSTVSDASENNKPVMVIIETTEDDSALDDLGVLDIYLIKSDQINNKKFSISDLNGMEAISAASHVMKNLESK